MIKIAKIAKKVNWKSSIKQLKLNKISRNYATNEVVIASATRTPITTFQGSFASVPAPELGAVAVKAALERANIEASAVEEVFLGNVISAGMKQAPARQAALKAGIPNTVPCTTINKVCASGMKSVIIGAQSIMLGVRDVVVTGGFENMSRVPYYLPKAREGYGYGHQKVIDGVLGDGLTDAFDDHHMGICGEDTAKKFNISREQQDQFAIESYKRATDATSSGRFKNEIVSVKVEGKKGKVTEISEDEQFKIINYDKISKLRPAFDKNGTITAANASKLNDGASALVLMSAKKAKELGVKPIAKILGFGDAAGAPIDFPTAPSKAVPPALEMAGVTKDQIDLWEINEAFSVVVLANMQLLGLDHSKVNVNGGAVSLGHPIGCSGGRIITTLVHLLHNKNASLGCANICNGGGGASAIVIQKI